MSTFRAKYTSANMGGEAAVFDAERAQPPVAGAQANGVITINDDVEAAPQKVGAVSVVESLGLNGDKLVVE